MAILFRTHNLKDF